uniref:NADH-ubiquinone oxidoreductase chain 5 n=1 Tax=Dilar sp. YW-2016 TaxID=1821762 RepID=A0A1S5QY60_9NEOP|nr:NADH dehydrogenase subunit 5 [Dilar sp. YW-2016]
MNFICFNSFISLFSVSMISFFVGVYLLSLDLVYIVDWEIISLGSCSVVMSVLLDWMSLLFMSLVLYISSMVIYYSNDYMQGDYNLNRFIILVLMFVLSMGFLIISPNLVSILLGWDGLGLVSYCLVIYYQNVKSYNAGMLTALSNRVGDVALLLSIAWLMNYGSWNYIYYLDCMGSIVEVQVISFLIILAGMTKSAQIPFSAWLPAAMAAPTPVSALVHSSTLVTAGVYLLIRFNNLLMYSSFLDYLLLIGGLTMFMSGLGANYEFDLKKIIALSTLSQLGLMVMTLSVGYYQLAFFHLLTHALFKALLFMCAGAMIHNLKNFQDIRYTGELMEYMPLTVTSMNVANMALCGFPFLAGFYSKDLILEESLMSVQSLLIFLLYFVSTGLTVSYSFRLMYYSLSSSVKFLSLNSLDHESWGMLKGMMGLLFMAIMGGSMLSWMIMPFPALIVLPFGLKVLVIFVIIMGLFIGYELFIMSEVGVKLTFYKLELFYQSFVGSMWFMPQISTGWISNSWLTWGGMLYKSVDQGWNEYLGAQSLYSYMKKYSLLINALQANDLKFYFLVLSIWVVLILLYLL